MLTSPGRSVTTQTMSSTTTLTRRSSPSSHWPINRATATTAHVAPPVVGARRHVSVNNSSQSSLFTVPLKQPGMLPYLDIKDHTMFILPCNVHTLYIFIYIIIRDCTRVGAFPRAFCVPNSVALASLTLQVVYWAIH